MNEILKFPSSCAFVPCAIVIEYVTRKFLSIREVEIGLMRYGFSKIFYSQCFRCLD